jgi:predicted DNA-binding transcriptional regulator AlpA
MSEQPYQIDPLLPIAKVAAAYGVSTKTIERWNDAGQIPAPVKRPGGSFAWRQSEVASHILGLEKAERKEMAS